MSTTSVTNEPTSSSRETDSISTTVSNDQAMLMSRQRRDLLKGILKEPATNQTMNEDSTEIENVSQITYNHKHH
jgi:hypothetical protein